MGPIAALAIGVALLAPATARADHPPAVPERALEAALGDRAIDVGDGLYRIPVRGEDLITHGPDAGLAGRAEVRGAGFGFGDPEREPVCGGEYHQHVLYGRPQSATDLYPASVEPIRAAVRRMNAVLNADSLAAGGPTADYRVRCDGAGAIEVGSFTSSSSSFGSIVDGAKAAGYDDPKVDYTIFFDGGGSGACGIGTYWDDDRPIASNRNNQGGSYGATYKGCWYGVTPMHENGHNQGAVQYGAPYSTGSGGHCWDDRDVMCYSPDGGDIGQEGTIARCSDRTYFDCGFDTYFDSAPEEGEWLASHWNIGSPLNRFIELGAADPSAPAANTPPGASFDISCVDLSCEFVDTSADSDGAIVSRSWSFGDGSTSEATNPRRSYAAPGEYAVRLTVVDDDGAATALSRQLSVSGPPAPPAPDPEGAAPAPVAPDPVVEPGRPPVIATGPARRLRNRARVRGSVAATGGWSRYVIRVPSRRRALRVELAGPACAANPCESDLDLYVRRRRAPQLERFDCAPLLVGSREACTIRRPRKGRWQVGVHAYEGGAAAEFTLKAAYRGNGKRRR